MNKSRRKSLSDAVDILSTAYAAVDSAREDEQDCLDSVPENLSDSEMATRFEDCIDYLDNAMLAIEEAIENINNAIE